MAKNERTAAVLDLRGLDLVTPIDLLKDGRTPYAKNFRLYAQQSDDRRVAVSSRKGPGFYINPFSETLSDSNTAVLGASTAKVGSTTNIHLQPVTATATGRITRADISIGNLDDATGPVLVEIWSDDGNNRPLRRLATSSIQGSDINTSVGYVTCRFLGAPKFTIGEKYWYVIYVQDDGEGEYTLSTTTSGTYAYSTNGLLETSTATTYAINFKTYVTPDGVFKGAYRFSRDNGNNVTVVVYGNTLYRIDEVTDALVSIGTAGNVAAVEYSFTHADNKLFWVDGLTAGVKCWDGTTITTITDPEMPIMSMILFHKERLFGVSASDPNRLVWSEAPGNPSNVATNLQWYNAWLSTSFWYVPRPHNGSPITGMVSFQDSLVIFTQDKKYIFSGYDKGSFNLRESTGAKGAISRRGIISDENRIYFVGDDGFYEFNGSSDTKLSSMINPLFDGCGVKEKITPVLWNNEVRFYMASEGSSVNDSCIIYNKDLKETMYDTETYVDRALYYNDADDNGELIEFSSLYPGAFQAEVNEHSLGAPIDFEYRLRYESMGSPAQKKRIRKFYPLLQGTDVGFPIQLAMDKDFEDSPRVQDLMLTSSTPKLGDFVLDGTTKLRGSTPFQLKRFGTSGWAYYWQLRIKRRGVNNRVAFIGAQYTYKTKRL